MTKKKLFKVRVTCITEMVVAAASENEAYETSSHWAATALERAPVIVSNWPESILPGDKLPSGWLNTDIPYGAIDTIIKDYLGQEPECP